MAIHSCENEINLPITTSLDKLIIKLTSDENYETEA